MASEGERLPCSANNNNNITQIMRTPSDIEGTRV